MLLFLLLIVASHGDASPMGNDDYSHDYASLSHPSAQNSHKNSTTQSVSWQREPRTRGTFRLLISCVITLSLCVWTAIHLNIPRQHTSVFRHYMKKTRWVLMGLFAPEMVVYVAWCQYKSASVLTRSMNEFFEESHQERKHPWTNVHSFYAGMGGFVIDTVDSVKGPYTSDSPRLSLGSRGVLFVAQHGGCIPDISKASIFDRSKVDNVGKFLACLQAGWAIVQCTSRLASHLPLTLLEINTLGHVLCALLMYMFWLQKPLDVNEPTVLIGEWTHPMCAWLLMSNSFSSRSKEWGIELSGLYVYPRGVREMLPSICLLADPAGKNHRECKAKSGPEGIVPETESDTTFIRVPQSVNSSPKDLDSASVPLQEHEILSGTIFGPKPNIRPKGSNTALATPTPIKTINLDLVTINRWRLASNFVSEHWSVIGFDPIEGLPEEPLAPNAIDFIDLIMLEVPDWPGRDQLYGHTNSTCAKLWAATILYGGLHAGAWNSTFPSVTETLLWRISAVLITGSGLTASIIAMVKHWKDQDDWKQTLRSYACRYLAMTPKAEYAMVIGLSEATFCAYNLTIMAIVPTFVLARLYLVVEAFISLRTLPIEAYQTPAWTQWIPHL